MNCINPQELYKGYKYVKAEQSPLFRLFHSVSVVTNSLINFHNKIQFTFQNDEGVFRCSDFSGMEFVVMKNSFNGHDGLKILLVDCVNRQIITSKHLKFHGIERSPDDPEIFRFPRALKSIRDINHYYDNSDPLGAIICSFNKSDVSVGTKEKETHSFPIDLICDEKKILGAILCPYYPSYDSSNSLKTLSPKNYKKFKRKLLNQHRQYWKEDIFDLCKPYLNIS